MVYILLSKKSHTLYKQKKIILHFIANTIKKILTLQIILKADFIICISHYIEKVFFKKLSNNKINKEDFLTCKKKIGRNVYVFLGIGANR